MNDGVAGRFAGGRATLLPFDYFVRWLIGDVRIETSPCLGSSKNGTSEASPERLAVYKQKHDEQLYNLTSYN